MLGNLIKEYTKELNRYRRMIQGYVKYWAPIMGLESWAEKEANFDCGLHPQNPGALAQAQIDWQHLAFVLTFYLGAIIKSGLSEERMEAVVVHEMVHVHLAEISPSQHECSPISEQSEERVVTTLTESFLRLKRRKK